MPTLVMLVKILVKNIRRTVSVFEFASLKMSMFDLFYNVYHYDVTT